MEWKEIEQKKESEVVFWHPEQLDDAISGQIISVQEGQYGNQWNIKADDGTIFLTPSHRVLQSALNEFNIGDFVKIIFIGEDAPKVQGRKKTKKYKILLGK